MGVFFKLSSSNNGIFFSRNAIRQAPHTVMSSLDCILNGTVFVGRWVNQKFCFELVKLDMAVTPECPDRSMYSMCISLRSVMQSVGQHCVRHTAREVKEEAVGCESRAQCRSTDREMGLQIWHP